MDSIDQIDPGLSEPFWIIHFEKVSFVKKNISHNVFPEKSQVWKLSFDALDGLCRPGYGGFLGTISNDSF